VVAVREESVVLFEARSSGFLRLAEEFSEKGAANGAVAEVNARLDDTAKPSETSCTQLLLVTPQ
jgi:hypothetical protein